MPELPIDPAKRGATLAPVLPRSSNRRSFGAEDSALARFRETHAGVMSRVARDLASGSDEGQQAASGAVKNVIEK
jgi:hypothetical protein